MGASIAFILDGRLQTIRFDSSSKYTPTTTVLNYLRSLPNHKGVKEGCAEGDCGACTVVLGEPDRDGRIRYRAVNSCLIFLPKLQGKWLITVEDLKGVDGKLHPLQQALVDFHGSQCGFCTPGFVMSLLALYKSDHPGNRTGIEDALTGNLCRCTGYQPIIEAAEYALARRQADRFTEMEASVLELLKTIPKESIHLSTDQQYYFLPATLDELLDLRAKHPRALVISGATDVALRVTKAHERLPVIIDLEQLQELRTIKEDKHSFFFGSAVNINELMQASAEWFPALYDMCRVFGSGQIREMATLGGNLGTASPIGDLLPLLAAYGANIQTLSRRGGRSMPLDEFIQGYRRTALRDDEIIESVHIPKPGQGKMVKSYKISKRKELDISTVSAAFSLSLDDSRQVRYIQIIYGGMAERVKHAQRAEQFLLRKLWSRETVEQAMLLIEQEFQPISDARSGAAFRTLAAKNCLLKFWSETNRDT